MKKNYVSLKNGSHILEPGFRVEDVGEILINHQRALLTTRMIYIALNKPVHYLCSSLDHFNRPLALDLIPESKEYRLYNVGRLDFESCGLILFTNDGGFCQRVSHPRYQVEKEYEVKLKKKVGYDQLKKMVEGVLMDDEILKIKSFKMGENENEVTLTLLEGKNREIRRLFKYFENEVKFLKRIRIGSIRLRGLPSGKRRILSKNEVEVFM
ncbi:MAG: pseudouridine synthase [Spirochaetia bacterium]